MSSNKMPVDSEATNTESVTENNPLNLLKFDEKNVLSSGKDINTKITSLDSDLAHLRAELSAINSSVEEGLDRLGDTDTDLTAKVSETYKRLGEIDNAYKSLIEISSRIDSDIKKLNGDVSTVAEQSASGIKTLEQSSLAQSNEFANKNQQVATQVNQLLETSKLTGDLLTQKIQITTEKMLQMEAHVVAEIESLSSDTKDKTQAIEVSVESNKAKILKLQSVDEAIIKRATTLEISSAELTVKSQDIQASVEQLQWSNSKLSNGLSELKEKTRALEDITNNHASLIHVTQKKISSVKDNFIALTNRESKHFNVLTTGLVLLLVAIVVIYFTQQYQLDVNGAMHAERNTVVNDHLTNMQQTQKDTTIIVNDSLAALEDKIDLMGAALQDNIKKEVVLLDHKVQAVHDQLQSVDARLTWSSPFSLMGNDNIIHGSQWIMALPEENFVVQLAYVDNTEALYEIAQRYNYYLKDVLSYFKVNEDGKIKYVLLSGNYTTQPQAVAQIQAMPAYIDMQQPVTKKLDTVQKYIAQN